MFKYPWGNLQGLNLAWFLEKFNQLLEAWTTAEASIEGALDDEIQKAEDALSDVFDARDAAAASATAAAGSAAQATTAANFAGNSASVAAASASAAQTAAANAAASETAAGNSASAAAGSATAAAGSATSASTAATNASASETAAGQSATAAAASETAAGQSATAAAASAAAAEAVEESIPADYTELSNTVRDLNIVYPQNIMSFYNTFSIKRTEKSQQFFTVKNNKIIVEKNNDLPANWYYLPFMLPNATPLSSADFQTFLNNNKSNFQKRLFNRVSIYGETDRPAASPNYDFGIAVSYLDANNDVVTRTHNLQFTTNTFVYELLTDEERAAEYIDISLYIRSNEQVTNNAIMIIGFDNV